MIDCFVNSLIRCFRRFGLIIGIQPIRCLLVSLAFVALCSAGLYRFQLRDDVRNGYAQPGAPSLYEHAIYRQFFGYTSPSLYALTMASTAKDGGSMIREAHLAAVIKLARFAVYNVSSIIDGNETLRLIDIIRESSLPLLEQFAQALKTQRYRENMGIDDPSSISIDYPTTNYYGHKLTMSFVFYNVSRNESSSIPNVWLVACYFIMQRGDGRQLEAAKEIELRLYDIVAAAKDNQDNLVDFQVYGEEIVNREVLIGAIGSCKYFLVGFVTMVLFVTISLHRRGQSIRTTCLLVSTCILSPLFAASSALGIISAFGNPINSMMCLIPFLLLGIGVDDAFIIMHAWNRIGNTKKHHLKANRLAETLAHVGPSISVTSLTNIMAFQIGAFSSPPQISQFCTCTAIALLFDFLLELTLFSAVVVITDDTQIVSCQDNRITTIGSKSSIWIDRYSRLLTTTTVRLILIVVMIVLWTMSIIGLYRMQATFAPEKTFEADSRLINSFRIVDEMYSEHENTLIIVNQPPQNSLQLIQFDQCIESLEQRPASCINTSMTSLWLRDYIEFDRNIYQQYSNNNQYQFGYDNVDKYLQSSLAFVPFVRWSRNTIGKLSVNAFAMHICSTGSKSWAQRSKTLTEIRRRIFNSCQSFNMSAFAIDSSVFDIIQTTSTITIRATIITICCMAFVCCLFIPNIPSAMAATMCIASIAIGVLGMLSWWRCDMDVIVMVDLLMAIGFTVDTVAHITYQYWRSNANLASTDRLVEAFSAVGLPMIQSGASTLICVIPLYFYNVYMYLTFVKTILLTIAFGLFHGLVVLPALLAALPNRMLASSNDAARETFLVNNVALSQQQ